MVNNPFSYLGAPFQGVPPEFPEGKKRKPAGRDHIHALGMRISVPRKEPEAAVAHVASTVQAKAKVVLTQSPPAPPPAPLSEAARVRKAAVQRASSVPTPAQQTLATHKGFAAAVRAPGPPPLPPKLSPQQERRMEHRKALEGLSPGLRADLGRSLKLANTPDAVMPKELLQSLVEIDGKVPVGLHVHMKNPASKVTKISGLRSVHNGIDGFVIKIEYGDVTKYWVAPRNRDIENLIENCRDFYGESAIRNVESVRLSPPSEKGIKMVVYRYEGEPFRDTSDNKRPGQALIIGIELPAKKAEDLYRTLKQHPEQARAFFICSAQNVGEADYIWSNRKPPYDLTDGERKLIFADEAAHDTMGQPLVAIDAQALELVHMEKKGGVWNESAFPKAALDDRSSNPTKLKRDALYKARRDASTKPKR